MFAVLAEGFCEIGVELGDRRVELDVTKLVDILKDMEEEEDEDDIGVLDNIRRVRTLRNDSIHQEQEMVQDMNEFKREIKDMPTTSRNVKKGPSQRAHQEFEEKVNS